MIRRVGVSTRAFEELNSLVSWVDGKAILITKYNGNYYAMNAVCAHRGCVLLTSAEGSVATCAAHGAKYDVTTGAMIEKPLVKPDLPCEYTESKTPLETYKVIETPEGALEIELRP